MKTLLEDYQRKLDNITTLVEKNKNNGSINDIERYTRLRTKESEYRAFIVDIERAIARNDNSDKKAKILVIETIIRRWGDVTATDLVSLPPCIFSAGIDESSVSGKESLVRVLIEEFNATHCNASIYWGENEAGCERYDYDELTDDMLDEVLAILQDYDRNMDLNEKHSRG